MPTSLAQQELVVVTGKGGVGKSSIAAALGRNLGEIQAVRAGATLILEIDPRESVHRQLGVPPSGGEIRRVGPGLYLQNLQPRRVIDRIVEKRVRVPALVRRVFASAIYEQFVTGAPGLEALAVLWHALRLVRGEVREAPQVARVVLDAPATGHGVSLLTAPRLVSEVIAGGPVGEMTREVAEWVSRQDLVGVVVAAMAEEMPVTEALDLRRRLSGELDREPQLLVVNAVYPKVPERLNSASDELTGLWRRRRRLNDSELSRLGKEWRRPDVELPLLPLGAGPELVSALAQPLARWTSASTSAGADAS
ncbi:MAG: hypothetical protein OES47_06100 [Acidobacteriota bacterium]|nr:hypothetical protein [Acidobacteriota bacterium]